MISNLFHSILVEPLFAFLQFVYGLPGIESLGVAIVVFTVTIRLVLLPLFYKGAKHQTLVQRLQPEVEKIRKKLKDKREEQAKALMLLYKEHKVNPFSGFLMLFVQIAIFFSLFWIFREGENIEFFSDPTFFGVPLVDPNIYFAVVVAALQYVQTKISFSTKKNMTGPMANFGKYMIYVVPAISLMVLTKFPAALALYWGISTLFSTGQQYIINKKLDRMDIEGSGKKDFDKKNETSKNHE